MILNLSEKSLINISYDWFSFYLIVDLFVFELTRLDENIFKYNEQYVMNEISLNDIDFVDDSTSKLMITQNVNFVMNSSTFASKLDSIDDLMFVEWRFHDYYITNLRRAIVTINQVLV